MRQLFPLQNSCLLVYVVPTGNHKVGEKVQLIPNSGQNIDFFFPSVFFF